jgi:hypothetical protein
MQIWFVLPQIGSICQKSLKEKISMRASPLFSVGRGFYLRTSCPRIWNLLLPTWGGDKNIRKRHIHTRSRWNCCRTTDTKFASMEGRRDGLQRQQVDPEKEKKEMAVSCKLQICRDCLDLGFIEFEEKTASLQLSKEHNCRATSSSNFLPKEKCLIMDVNLFFRCPSCDQDCGRNPLKLDDEE